MTGSSPAGAKGDLWKKVLDEVQTEAAARRTKAAARSAAAPHRSTLELDLLKQILQAIESKFEALGTPGSPGAPGSTAASSAPPTAADPLPLLKQILEAVQNQAAAIQSAAAATTPLPPPAPPIADQLQPFWDQLRKDVADQVAAQVASQVASQVAAALAALPKPADPAPQLAAILEALKSQPAAPSIDPESLAAQLAQAVRQQGTEPPTEAVTAPLRELSAQVLALTEQLTAMPRPVDVTAKLDALLAAAAETKPPAEIEPALSAAIAPLIEQLKSLDTSQAGQQEQLLAQIREQVKAAAMPADLLEQIKAQIKVELESALAAQAQRTSQELAQSQEAMTKSQDAMLKSQEAIAQSHQAVAQSNEAMARTREAITQSHDALMQTREAIAQVAAQGAGLREDLLAQSIEIIDQVKAQSPAAIEAAMHEVRARIDEKLEALPVQLVAALPKPAEAKPVNLVAQLGPQFDALLDAIINQPRPPALDQDALADKVVGKVAGQVVAPLVSQIVAQVVERIAALPKPAPFDPASIPSHDAEFARQEKLLHALQAAVKDLATAKDEPATIDALRGDMQNLAEANRQTQQVVDRSLNAAMSKLEAKLETKLNIGFAKLELAMATGDTGRPHDVIADDDSMPPAPKYDYSWMTQSAGRSRMVPIAMGITAVAALGMFIILLINALTGDPQPRQTLAVNPPASGAADTKPSGKSTEPPVTPAIPPGAPDPSTPTTPDNLAGNDANKDDVAAKPPTIFPAPSTTLPGDGPAIAPTVISALKDLTNPSAPINSDNIGNDPRGVLDLDQAKSIVFVVHAQTASPAVMATILGELKKSLAQIKSTQKFTVVFSKDSTFVEVPPHGLREGSAAEHQRVQTWIDANITVQEKPATNPLVALDVSIFYAPDLLWIISDGLAGQGQGQVSAKEILDRIATLNPDRATRIAATQVGQPDSADTLKTLASKYGGSYTRAGEGPAAQRP